MEWNKNVSFLFKLPPTSFTSNFTSFARKVTQSRAKIWSMGDNWNMENLIVLTPAWSSMKEPQKGSRQWRAWINKPSVYAGLRHLSTSKDALKDVFWHSHLHQYERVHNLKRIRLNRIWTTKRTFSKEI